MIPAIILLTHFADALKSISRKHHHNTKKLTEVKCKIIYKHKKQSALNMSSKSFCFGGSTKFRHLPSTKNSSDRSPRNFFGESRTIEIFLFLMKSFTLFTMKSKQVWMKSKPLALMKLNPSFYPCEARFHHEVISSAKQISSVARRI